jgi:DNA polymerase-3 subunit delta'
MLFSEIPGQDKIKERLIRSVSDKRIPHAQLFRGPEGVGKLALAVAYAQYICCENRTETDSCGTCPSCVKYTKLAHPDLHLVFPVIKPTGKSTVVCDDFVADFRKIVTEKIFFGVDEWYQAISGEAKQGMIYANESQEIIRKLSLKTYESEHKVMIIWLPEKMNIQCSNKLLKILEEPPAMTVFLLVSNQPDEIITTILSRTQHINIPGLNEHEIVSALLKNGSNDITQHDALNIARIANGSFLTAQRLLKAGDEQKVNFDRFVTVMRLAWNVGNKKDHASLKTLKKWSDEISASSVGRERQKGFLSYSQRMIRENFILNLKHPELNYLNQTEADFSSRFHTFIHERNVEELSSEFSLAERHIEQNVNAKMVFFDLMLKIIMLLKKEKF